MKITNTLPSLLVRQYRAEMRSAALSARQEMHPTAFNSSTEFTTVTERAAFYLRSAISYRNMALGWEQRATT